MTRISLLLILVISGCTNSGQQTVVVYTSLDELYSRSIFDAFETETGIRVRALYDTEASKTSGLVNRLIAEKGRPRADVFWNNETAQTIVLKRAGVLAPYASPAAAAIPPRFKDPESYWCGFAARARVIIYNTDAVSDPPASIRDFADPRWRGRAAIANPLFGTTATHAAALFAHWGDDEAKAFFHALKANDIAILPGNATVRDLVARGEYDIGLTDTDDANGAIEDGLPAAWRFPDQKTGADQELGAGQQSDSLGTLLIPNTVALIAGAPHPDAAKALIDFLLSPQVESMLANSRSIQIPLNSAVAKPDNVPDIDEIVTMPIDFEAIAAVMKRSAQFISDEFQP